MDRKRELETEEKRTRGWVWQELARHLRVRNIRRGASRDTLLLLSLLRQATMVERVINTRGPYLGTYYNEFNSYRQQKGPLFWYLSQETKNNNSPLPHRVIHKCRVNPQGLGFMGIRALGRGSWAWAQFP